MAAVGYTPPPLTKGYTPPPLTKGYTPPPLVSGGYKAPRPGQPLPSARGWLSGPVSSGMIPGGASGTATMSLGMKQAFATPAKVQRQQNNTKNRPSGSDGAGGDPPPVMQPATPMTQAQLLAQINTLMAAMGHNPHTPASLSLSHIAQLVNQLPTSPSIPGMFSLSNVAKAMTPGKSTPGYVDPAAAANAAADAQYGQALTQDQANVNTQQAQSKQNLADIQNWYDAMVAQAHDNAQQDDAGYNAAIQGTGNLGTVANALGMAPGSDGANSIDAVGSIMNSAARLAAASESANNRNVIQDMGLSGVADYQNQANKDAQTLAALQNTLNSDQKGRGNAFVTAKDAATQANAQNASTYAQELGSINQAYNNNFQNYLKAKQGVVAQLQGLNNQYTTQGLNQLKTHIAGLTTAAGLLALPGQLAGQTTKNNYTAASAYAATKNASANYLKAQTGYIKAQAQAANQTQAQWLKGSEARFGLGGQIAKSVYADPKAFTADPTTGAVTLKNPKQAKTDIAAMLIQAGYDPTKGVGSILNETALAIILGQHGNGQ